MEVEDTAGAALLSDIARCSTSSYALFAIISTEIATANDLR